MANDGTRSCIFLHGRVGGVNTRIRIHMIGEYGMAWRMKYTMYTMWSNS